MTTRKNKYSYIKIIQRYCSYYGWEDVSEYDRKDRGIYADLREYRLSENAPYRIINRRVLNVQ